MAVKTIETKAIISAEDKTGNAFGAVVQKLAKMESAARAANTSLHSIDRAAQTTRRAELAHDRERLKVQREMSHHGAARYATQAAASAVAAHSIIEGITESLKGGAELQHSLTALKNSGRTVEEIAEIMNRAVEVMKAVPTSSLKENRNTVLETTGAFGSLHHAMENLEFVQKATSVLKASGDAEASPKSVAYDFAKFAEIRGSAGNSERMQAESNKMIQAMVFSGGKFNPHEALEFATMTSADLGNYNMRFLSRIMPSLATEMGGRTAGTRASAFSDVIMGRARDGTQAKEWARLGLIDPKLITSGSKGPIGWKAGAIQGTAMAQQDPFEWAEKVLMPAMKSHGVNMDVPAEVSKELATLFRNKESRRFATAIVADLQRTRLLNDEKMTDKGGIVDDIYKRNLNEDPTVAMGALTESLHSLMAVISQPAMKSAAAGLSGLATGIQTLASTLKDHPLLALGGGAAVGGGALAGAGRLAYLAANGFGLSTSAAALDHSALMLDGAAMRLGTAGAVGSAESLAGGALAAEKGLMALAAEAATLVGALALFDGAMVGIASWYKSSHPDEFHAHAQHAYGLDRPADPLMEFKRSPRRGSSGTWQLKKPDGTTDYTLGAPDHFVSGKADAKPFSFAPGTGSFVNPNSPGLAARNPRSDVFVDFTQPPPQKLLVEVVAGSALLDVLNKVKQMEFQMKADARNKPHVGDSGPGGLGETHTDQH